MGEKVELLRGTDTTRVEEFPWGKKNSGVTHKGEGVPGADRRGRGGDGNSPSTQDTKGISTTRRREDMESDQEPEAPPSKWRGIS